MSSESTVTSLIHASQRLFEAGRYTDALNYINDALALDACNVAIRINKGMVLNRCGRQQESIECLSTVLKEEPNHPDAHVYLAAAYRDSGCYQESLQHLEYILRLYPDYSLALIQLGLLYLVLQRNIEAEQAFSRALVQMPESPEAWTNIGISFQHQAQYSNALLSHEKALSLAPKFHYAQSNLQMSMQYDPDLSADELLAGARIWGRQSTDGGKKTWCREKKGERLRVGFLSGDFSAHPVGWFFRGIFKSFDKEKFEWFCYANQRVSDSLTDEFRLFADHWRNVIDLADEELRSLILDDDLDILVDLSGHTAGSRLPVMAERLAAIQLSWLGFFASTGLSSIDAVLLGEDVAGTAGNCFYEEKIIPLTGCHFCYTPPDYAPTVSPLPLEKRGFLTFGSFNNTDKLNDQVLALWAQILKAVPASRLVIKWKTLSDPLFCNQLLSRFTFFGVDINRIDLRAASTHERMLQEYGDIDIALDSFPFSGALTTCEALWMGVPVITLPWERPVSRQTMMILKSLGLDEWIAHSPDEYVKNALMLSSNVSELRERRASLRQIMQMSELCQPDLFARRLEAIFQTLVDGASQD